MALAKDIETLKDIQCEEGKCVLSVYLNTDRANQNQQKGEWKIRLKNGLKRLEEYLVAAGNEEELKSYKKLRKKVEKEVKGNQSKLLKSVVIFASDDQDLWSVHYLQLPVETSFHWESRPILDQLEKLQKSFPKSAIIMPNLDEVKILDIDLGEIKDTRTYFFDPETEDWRFKDGIASSDRMASSANHVDDYQQRFDENRNRFYKKIAMNIEGMKKEKKWESVYIIGEPEAAQSLESQLNVDVSLTIKKNLKNSDSSKVLAHVFE
ncbi:VLRF1 family aeRF1-type release factor [Evansella sp. AB-rgal1]|uniref:VLRF1 family aeRF1-type release factor n=1 Tax=Evansella sp. AB-rgal1 TaxID=3242696 RepID=UPI00359E4D85